MAKSGQVKTSFHQLTSLNFPRYVFMNINHCCVISIDLFTDMAAILNSIVSNSYYGMPRGQISMYLPPEHPIIDI